MEVLNESDPAALATRIAEIAKARNVAVILLGLPLSMDGTEGDRAKLARAFGDKLADVSGLTVEYLDERLTSAQAERAMIGTKRKEKKAKADAVAAQILLQSYLDRNR